MQNYPKKKDPKLHLCESGLYTCTITDIFSSVADILQGSLSEGG